MAKEGIPTKRDRYLHIPAYSYPIPFNVGNYSAMAR